MRVRVKWAHFPVGMGEVHPQLRVVPTHSSAECMIMSSLVISSGGESDPYRPFREKSSTVKVMVRFYSLLTCGPLYKPEMQHQSNIHLFFVLHVVTMRFLLVSGHNCSDYFISSIRFSFLQDTIILFKKYYMHSICDIISGYT
jgi:hypothetical protein